MLFGKPATAEKWIVLTIPNRKVFAGVLSIPMLFLFRGVVKKTILQDLNDIKSAVEQESIVA